VCKTPRRAARRSGRARPLDAGVTHRDARTKTERAESGLMESPVLRPACRHADETLDEVKTTFNQKSFLFLLLSLMRGFVIMEAGRAEWPLGSVLYSTSIGP